MPLSMLLDRYCRDILQLHVVALKLSNTSGVGKFCFREEYLQDQWGVRTCFVKVSFRYAQHKNLKINLQKGVLSHAR